MTRSRPHRSFGARRLAPASSGAVLAALVELLGSVAAGEPRLRIEPWSADLAPPVYVPADSMHARRRAPDTLGVREHEPLEAGFATSPRLVDGQLDDWRLVRWYELTGASALFRGAWTGPLDYGLRFALCWTRDGLLLGGRFSDDDPSARALASHPTADRVTLALASGDPVVERYWMGASRRFRFGRDGRLEAWTELRSRRPELFDAAALGVRVVQRASPAPGGAPGPLEFELFVPWTALFPLLPVPGREMFVNVIVEDTDARGEKAAAWATAREDDKPRASWARLEWSAGVAAPEWIVSTGTLVPDPWCEWALVRCRTQGGSRSRTIELRARDLPGVTAPLRAALPAGDRFLVQLGPVDSGRTVWPSERLAHIEMRLPGDAGKREWEFRLRVDAALAGEAAASATAAIRASPSAAFPAATDVVVRLARAREEIESMGSWAERRFDPTGILVWRAATRARVEHLLEEAEVLRDAVAAGADIAARDAALARRWPRRGLGGLPADEVFLRGSFSEIDGTVQPHTVFVPASAGPHPPLVVALHDVDQDESTLFESTRLAERCAERGWVVLCPAGRGTSGYMTAGERDVVEAIAAVREALPVDGRRLYVTGLGMGGTGAWLLPLRHPDLFAASAVVSGYGDFDQPGLFEFLGYRPAEESWYAAHNPMKLVKRRMTTAYRIAHGERDAIVSPVHARVLHARLQELGVPHEYRLDPQGDHGMRFFDDELPASLEFFARHARASDGAADPGAFGGVGPPIADVFARGPFAIVWGTAPPLSRGSGQEPVTVDLAGRKVPEDLATAQELAAEWKSTYRGIAPVVADTSVTEEMMRTTTLVLVGDPQTNTLLRRWKDRLPVRYEWGLCLIGKAGYPLDKYGVLFAAVHPEFRDRTLVVASGLRERVRLLPRSAFAIAAAYAVVSPTQGVVEIGNFEAGR